jgi:hypothetical protein
MGVSDCTFLFAMLVDFDGGEHRTRNYPHAGGLELTAPLLKSLKVSSLDQIIFVFL